MLKNLHQLYVIIILEPFSNSVHVQSIKAQLNMENATSNCNGKIWVFWSNDIDCNILDEEEQQISCNMKHNELQYKFIVPLPMLNAKITSVDLFGTKLFRKLVWMITLGVLLVISML